MLKDLEDASARGHASQRDATVHALGERHEPVAIAVDQLAVRFGGQWTAKAGGAVAYDVEQVDAHMRRRLIDILVDVALGSGQAKVWTCDLTHGYISINGDYRS